MAEKALVRENLLCDIKFAIILKQSDKNFLLNYCKSFQGFWKVTLNYQSQEKFHEKSYFNLIKNKNFKKNWKKRWYKINVYANIYNWLIIIFECNL